MLLEFFMGILICIPLIPFNDLILKWAEKDPLKSIGIVSIMMAVNAIIILSYGFLNNQKCLLKLLGSKIIRYYYKYVCFAIL